MTVKDLINHVAFVIDESSSMADHADAVVKVFDNQVAHLAQQSQAMNMETRVSVYLFADDTKCIIFDKDVLRLPSLKGLYAPNGWTALRDATLQSQRDLRKTATMYGDHAFLTFILTDGNENRSRITRESELREHLQTVQDNETIGLLVPDWLSRQAAERMGFPRGNIAVWDAASATGMDGAMDTMRKATDSYMVARTQGVRSSTGVFSMDPAAVNHKTVAASLKEMTGFRVEKVKGPVAIKEFIERLGLPFVIGAYYFPFVKREKISDAKEILIRHKISGKIYGGPAARALVGLPDSGEVSVKPQENPEYDVYVQSTSNNRNLIAGHDLLIRI